MATDTPGEKGSGLELTYAGPYVNSRPDPNCLPTPRPAHRQPNQRQQQGHGRGKGPGKEPKSPVQDGLRVHPHFHLQGLAGPAIAKPLLPGEDVASIGLTVRAIFEPLDVVKQDAA